MIVNRATLEGVYETFRAIFDDYISRAGDFDFSAFVQNVPTSTITVNYNWLENIPAMREWIGDKIVQNLTANNFEISSIEYEVTLGVKRRDIETDNLGIYRPQIEMLADEARLHRLRLFAALIEANPITWDGQNLFDTDHPKIGGGTYSNKGTTALAAAPLTAARLAMMKLADSEGRRLGIRPSVLMIPPDLEDTAANLLLAQNVIGSGNNDINPINRYGLSYEVNPFLTDANNWYLFDNSKAVKAVFHQHRVEPHLVAQTSEASDIVFQRGEFQYSVEADYTLVAGFPQVCYGAVVA